MLTKICQLVYPYTSNRTLIIISILKVILFANIFLATHTRSKLNVQLPFKPKLSKKSFKY